MLRGETPPEEEARVFDVAMILHAEHEMNASTFTARVVAGTNADLHSRSSRRLRAQGTAPRRRQSAAMR